MKNNLYTACDFCGTPLTGLVGAAKTHKNYIQLKGDLCHATWHEKENKYWYDYAQKPGESVWLDFCNYVCLRDYINTRRDFVINYNAKKHAEREHTASIISSNEDKFDVAGNPL